MPLRRSVLTVLLASITADPLRAAAADDTVLTIVRDGVKTNFSMAMLEKLPQKTFTTRTPWYPQVRTFTGPLLRDVLEAAKASGSELRLIALNDYRISMPSTDADRFEVIVARLLDGRPMPVREKGPLFVVYPFDDTPELHTQVYYIRCAWQLRTIEVR